MRSHVKLLCDAALVMRTTTMMVIWIAMCYDCDDDPRLVADEANIIVEKFNETGILPDYIENFCISILVGEIPVVSEDGIVLNPRKRKLLS